MFKKPAPTIGRLVRAREDWSTVYECMRTGLETCTRQERILVLTCFLPPCQNRLWKYVAAIGRRRRASWMVGVYFESLSWCSSLSLVCRAEVGRRVAVEDSRSELGQAAHQVPDDILFLAVDDKRSKTCLCRMERVCRDRIPTTLSLTAADRAGGHQYAAAEGPGCSGPRGLCLSIYLGAG